MRKIENIIIDEIPIAETLNLGDILGRKVLSNKGQVIGHAKEIRLNPKTQTLEGVVIKTSSGKLIYMGESYLENISHDGLILKIEPSIFTIEKKVITFEGKIIGKVVKVNRRGEKNDIKSIVLGSMLKRKTEIPISAIKKISKNIMLKEGYNVKQKYIWQKI